MHNKLKTISTKFVKFLSIIFCLLFIFNYSFAQKDIFFHNGYTRDALSGKIIYKFRGDLVNYKSNIIANEESELMDNGRLLFSIELYDLFTGKKIKSFKHGDIDFFSKNNTLRTDIIFSNDGKYICSSLGQDGSIIIWDLKALTKLKTFKIDNNNKERIQFYCFDYENNYLLAKVGEKIIVINASSGIIYSSFDLHSKWEHPVTNININNIICSYFDGEKAYLYLLEVPSLEIINKVESPRSGNGFVLFNQDGTQIIYNFGNDLLFLNSTNGHKIKSVDFSIIKSPFPDNSYRISSCYDNNLLILWSEYKKPNNKIVFFDVNYGILQTIEGNYINLNINGTHLAYELDNEIKIFKINYDELFLNKVNEIIRESVVSKVNKWQQIDKFETTFDFSKRVTEESRNKLILEFTQEAIDSLGNIFVKLLNPINDYDANNQVYKITFEDNVAIFLKIPIEEARSFDANFNSIQYKNPSFTITDKGKFDLLSMEAYNPTNNKTYNYNSNELVKFNPVNLTINFDPIGNLDTKAKQDVKFEEEVIDVIVGKSDVDVNLPPKTKTNNSNSYAVIIGNANYDNLTPVTYADNSAIIIKKYLIEVLGYNENNIFFDTAATKDFFELHFGSKIKKGKLYNNVKSDISEVFIYIAGHCVVDTDKKGYLQSKLSDKNYPQLGYSIDVLYENLLQIPAKRKIIILDVCYSGREAIASTPEYSINPEHSPNTIFLTSCKKKEVSSWYEEKGHRMFTYFFLKAIHNKNADNNPKDNKLTFKEIYNYVSDPINGVPYFSKSKNGLLQNPDMFGGLDSNKVFIYFSK